MRVLARNDIYIRRTKTMWTAVPTNRRYNIDMKKVAIVTGGTRGIGFAIAQRMIKAGFATCIMSRSSEADCAEALSKLRATQSAQPPEVFYMAGGIGVAADREAFVGEVVKRYGRVDVLVNNAGVAPKVRADLLEATEESFDYVTGINLKGTMFMSQLWPIRC